MKFSIDLEQMKELLKEPKRIAAQARKYVTQGDLLIEAEDGEIRVRGSSESMTSVASADGVDVAENGGAVVNAAKLGKICSLLDDSTVNVSMREDGTQIIIKSGRSRFTLNSVHPATYPAIKHEEQRKTVTIPAPELAHLLSVASRAMAKNDVRYFLNSCLFDFAGNTLTVVATDGHRLHKAVYVMDDVVEDDFRAVVPESMVNELMSFLKPISGAIDMSFGRNNMVVHHGNEVIEALLIGDKFPDYTAVIPAGGASTISVPVDELLAALKQAAIVASQARRECVLRNEDSKFIVEAVDDDGKIAFHTPLESATIEGEVATQRLQVDYLLDAISVIEGEQVKLHGNLNFGPMLIKDPANPDSDFVVMPLR